MKPRATRSPVESRSPLAFTPDTTPGVAAAPSNATLLMQLGRIIREANNPKRQLFTDALKARRFLEEELTDPHDREPLDEFLAG